jgi:hypothetical protein
LTLLPILDHSHKGCVVKIAKVPLQISFKHSEPFLAFLVNFWKKLFTWDNTFCFVLKGNFMQEKSQNLSGKQGKESMIWDNMFCINGCMVIANLLISLVPYLQYGNIGCGVSCSLRDTKSNWLLPKSEAFQHAALQMFTGIYRDSAGKSECGDFKFMGIAWIPTIPVILKSPHSDFHVKIVGIWIFRDIHAKFAGISCKF